MNFAQFTNRSGLRDIETTLDPCSQDLYRSGLKIMPKSTLAEANEKMDWRIYQDFGYVLIQKAKKLYEGEKLRIDLDEMVCAFIRTTRGLSPEPRIICCTQLLSLEKLILKRGLSPMRRYNLQDFILLRSILATSDLLYMRTLETAKSIDSSLIISRLMQSLLQS